MKFATFLGSKASFLLHVFPAFLCKNVPFLTFHPPEPIKTAPAFAQADLALGGRGLGSETFQVALLFPHSLKPGLVW
jgi:hypothetical protein